MTRILPDLSSATRQHFQRLLARADAGKTINISGMSDAEILALVTPSSARNGATQKKGGSPGDARQRGFDMLHKIADRRPADNLAVWLDRGRADIFTVTVWMTPELAARLLQKNPDNRPLRLRGDRRSVEAYAAAMRRGEWELNGQGIVISDDGELNDGQHRLHAVILADMQVEMQITFGVRRNTRHTVDQGAARTPGNILSMMGEVDGNVLAHAVQFVWAYDNDRTFNDRPSSEQLLDCLDANPALREALKPGRKIAGEFRVSPGYLAGAFYVCSRVDKPSVEDFAHGVATGLNVATSSSPIYKIRKRFTDHLTKKESIPAVEQAAFFIKAFNWYRRGRSAQQLVWRRNGAAAEAFPRAS